MHKDQSNLCISNNNQSIPLKGGMFMVDIIPCIIISNEQNCLDTYLHINLLNHLYKLKLGWDNNPKNNLIELFYLAFPVDLILKLIYRSAALVALLAIKIIV
jgi:hypothetical protein